MVSIIHNPTSTHTPMAASMNEGSCHDLVEYLSKEEGGWEKSQGFFSAEQDCLTALQAEALVDGNTQGIHKWEDKFYMLTLNPSEQELQTLVFELTGRPGITNFDYLSAEEKEKVFDALKDFTRACMDRYAWNFNREGIETGDDLVYFARIETERHCQGTDKDVLDGKAKSGDRKPGLQLHVHVCVSRRGREGKMLNPMGKPCKKEFQRDKSIPGRFNRKAWIYQNAQSFYAMYGYTDPLDFVMGEGRGRSSFPSINPAEDKEMQFWLLQMQRKARRLQRWTDITGHSDLLDAPKKAFRIGRFMLAFVHNPTHALFNKAFSTLLMGAVRQMDGSI